MKKRANVKPIPDGYHSINPYLTCKNAAKAIDFYKKALGATEIMRMAGPDGKIGHAELKIGDSIFMMADECPDTKNKSPESLGGTPITLMLYVEDVDFVAKQAEKQGMKTARPIQDQF